MPNLITLKTDGTFACETVHSPVDLDDMQGRLGRGCITYAPARYESSDLSAEDLRGRACVVADDEGLPKGLPKNKWSEFVAALGYILPFDSGGLKGDLLLVPLDDAEGEHSGAVDPRIVDCVRAYGQTQDSAIRAEMLKSLKEHGRINRNDSN
jgi:hypothetical protein